MLVHVVTKKGKGYPPAEAADDKYHGVSAFDVVARAAQAKPKTNAPTYTRVFADALVDAARRDDKIVGITAPTLAVEHAPGTEIQYLGFNLRDPVLKDARVRQAIAYALDRRPMIEYLWHGWARPARSVLPTQSWAYNGNVPSYDHDPAKARALLDTAGYPALNGIRFHITMKTSTDENTRLMVAVMQQQLREVRRGHVVEGLVPRPNAFTGLLSQMPILLSKMWLWAITVRTRVPPENTRTPVVFMSVGEAGESSVSPSRLFVPILLPMILLPLRSSNWPGISVCACMVTPDSPLPAMKLPSTRLLYDAVPAVGIREQNARAFALAAVVGDHVVHDGVVIDSGDGRLPLPLGVQRGRVVTGHRDSAVGGVAGDDVVLDHVVVGRPGLVGQHPRRSCPR